MEVLTNYDKVMSFSPLATLDRVISNQIEKLKRVISNDPCVEEVHVVLHQHNRLKNRLAAFIVLDENQLFRYVDQSHREPDEYARLIHRVVEKRLNFACNRVFQQFPLIQYFFIDSFPFNALNQVNEQQLIDIYISP